MKSVALIILAVIALAGWIYLGGHVGEPSGSSQAGPMPASILAKETEMPPLHEPADVVHKVFVPVDEPGTKTPAATAVVMPAAMIREEPVEVTVDRPFVFLIHDIETGTILFVGRVVNASA